jgi:hypothetical protein
MKMQPCESHGLCSFRYNLSIVVVVVVVVVGSRKILKLYGDSLRVDGLSSIQGRGNHLSVHHQI